eukprot:236532-Rhodomonas_salina.1
MMTGPGRDTVRVRQYRRWRSECVGDSSPKCDEKPYRSLIAVRDRKSLWVGSPAQITSPLGEAALPSRSRRPRRRPRNPDDDDIRNRNFSTICTRNVTCKRLSLGLPGGHPQHRIVMCDPLGFPVPATADDSTQASSQRRAADVARRPKFGIISGRKATRKTCKGCGKSTRCGPPGHGGAVATGEVNEVRGKSTRSSRMSGKSTRRGGSQHSLFTEDLGVQARTMIS